MAIELEEHAKADVWNRILRSALALPGARIDRTGYLRKELRKHVAEDVVELAIASSPVKAGISSSQIGKIASSSISWHRTGVTGASVAAGLPGGWWMAGTIPGDLTQFFWHAIVVTQKLAYLHGWPELCADGEELDDETLHILTIFVGVMFGAAGANTLLSRVAENIAKEVAVRLPRMALTRWGLYNLAKEVAKWIGVRLTKQTFARIASKAVPLVGGLASGAITWVSFSQMSSRLATHLATLHPHTGR
ncbi:hypothetical protein [Paraburkholderia adhaesiva]|uniref:hypothetical protein n=1 Tax=Paraburkholderia adhaesiva TaxID=2883244 RepID=UPI001F23ADE1|nr:hypothetical protein [Paraburkholderia adhaesiva]